MGLESVWTLFDGIFGLTLSFFSIFLPVINTVRSIITKDDEAQREFLTYWTIYALTEAFGMLLGLIISVELSGACVLSILKVLWYMWLTSPECQGAFRIYSLAVRPFFITFEDDIDTVIDSISSHVWVRIRRVIQVVIWEVLFTSQDDVIMSTLQSTLKKGNDLYNSFLSGNISSDALVSDEILQPQTDGKAFLALLKSGLLLNISSLPASSHNTTKTGTSLIASASADKDKINYGPTVLRVEKDDLVLIPVGGKADSLPSFFSQIPLSNIKLKNCSSWEKKNVILDIDIQLQHQSLSSDKVVAHAVDEIMNDENRVNKQMVETVSLGMPIKTSSSSANANAPAQAIPTSSQSGGILVLVTNDETAAKSLYLGLATLLPIST